MEHLTMGNIDAKRDWGHARDYVYGMWLMMQSNTPDDYVLATNKFYSVREFIEQAFALRGFNIKWRGSGLQEVGYDETSNRVLIRISEQYFRPTEVEELLGNANKANTQLEWYPKVSFPELVRDMVDHDCP